MRHNRSQNTLKELLTIMGAVSLLTACSTGPVKTEPDPKITQDVLNVKALVDKDNPVPGTTYEQMFAQYPGCVAKTIVWEEMEPGVVFFTCRAPVGGIIQFIWHADGKGGYTLKSSVVSTQYDSEFAGTEYRGKDAQARLDDVRQKRLILDSPSIAPKGVW